MAITFVQKTSAQTTVTAASLTTPSLTTTAGNFISVQGSQGITATAPTSFSDNKSNAYTIDKNVGDSVNGNFATNVAVGSNISLGTAGAGHTFTINKTGGGVGLAIGVCEYTHGGAMSVTATNTSANGGSGGGTAMNPGAMNPTGANLLYVSAATDDNITGATYTANTGAGWAMETNLTGLASAQPALASSDVIGSGSKTGTITASSSAHWIAVGQTYLEAAAGGTLQSLLSILGAGV